MKYGTGPEGPHGQYKMNIIAAEDDMVAATAIRGIFEDKNCSIMILPTGKELLQALNNNYDLVLLDLELPDINGFDIATTIRNRVDALAHIPIVALTAHQEKHQLDLARQVGINGFLTKPLSAGKCNLLLNDFKCRH